MDNVPVRISDCRCPGTPHEEGDFGYLRPFLDYAGGAEALRMMAAAEGDVTRFGELVGPVYIRRGMVGWNRLDEDGNPVPLPDDPSTAMPYEEAYWLAEKADDLYGESVLAPLALKIKKSSPSGQMDGLTSPKRRSRSKRPVQSASS